jgi:hypothetical protein
MDSTKSELELREIWQMLAAKIQVLKSNWRQLVLTTLIAGLLGITYAKFIAIPKYTGNLSFVLSNDSKTGSLGALAGNFGIDLGGGTEGAFAGENIIQLLLSRRMIERALVKPIPGTSSTLLQEIVDDLEKSGKGNNTCRVNFHFQTMCPDFQ